MLALTLVAALAAAAGLRGSRWYVTSLFSTYIVFLMLLGAHPEQTQQKFNERVGETLLGVGLAFLSCWLLPVEVLRLDRRSGPTSPVNAPPA